MSKVRQGKLTTRSRRRATRLVASAAATLAVAGCGGGAPSGTPSTLPRATTTSPPATGAQATPADRFHEGLVNRSGFTERQASCIVKRVLAKIGRAEFDRLYGHGNTPDRVQQVILKANLKCAPRGAGQ
jgi:hypothetical protein